ncbi:hypothetical protein TVAG_339180 [Trichomonas vaginalis G3]|uniref:Uncharacterized protein n=1 Tax=Trichomonas vaginalis (strain ATCC PRA-98 / G3) TaxID=412133 RepID=A2FMT1_TRIV3|nr:hypothetical protein TVAGG3_0300330 [Trichomonas vaginalis G3]EAX93795.1 hypothetical protein TVAG_339180 [Trichomonas vaginalis G3]KAI5527842.1 hypothetical protein TVAGG3_0300330 [Trichomonas vaginalis G3]|eukprot:XP_001306725.1 hypothetical protein [Trichomonas vaginalis G3]
MTPIPILLAILFIEIAIHGSELYTLYQQRTSIPVLLSEASSFNYQFKNTLVNLLENISKVIFYITIYKTAHKTFKIVRNNYNFFTFLIIFRYLLVILPSRLIKLLVIDTNIKPNIQLFVQKQLIEQLTIWLLSTTFLNILNYIAVRTNSFVNVAEITPLIDQVEDSPVNTFSSDSDYYYSYSSISQSRARENRRRATRTYAYSRPLYLYLGLVLLILLLIQPLTARINSRIGSKFIINTVSHNKFLGSLQLLHGMNFNKILIERTYNTPKQIDYKINGYFNRELIISEPTMMKLKSNDLTAIFANYYYLMNSHEEMAKFVISLIEIVSLSLLFRKVLAERFNKLSKIPKIQMSYLLPIYLAYAFPVHFFFEVLRMNTTKYFIIKGDEYAFKHNLPINDTLIKVYTYNLDLFRHSHIYSLLTFSMPTLSDRLSVIARKKVELQISS